MDTTPQALPEERSANGRQDGGSGLSSKQRIERSATGLFARHGYQGAVIKQIVDRANVTKPTLYYHFQDKDELYLNVVRNAFKTVAGRIRKHEFSSEEPIERIDELLNLLTRLAEELPDEITVLFTAWYSPPKSVPRKQGIDGLREQLVDLIKETVSPAPLPHAKVGGTDLTCAAELTLGVVSQVVWHSLLQEGGKCPTEMVKGMTAGLVEGWQ